MLIGPAGGFVLSADGRAGLRVPEGALSEDAELVVELLPSSLPEGSLLYALTPAELALAAPAELRIGLLHPELRYALAEVEGGEARFVAGAVYDASTHELSAALPRLGRYAAFALDRPQPPGPSCCPFDAGDLGCSCGIDAGFVGEPGSLDGGPTSPDAGFTSFDAL